MKQPRFPSTGSPQADSWTALRRYTPARIALGRSGVSLPTREVLAFAQAHAEARDAIHLPIDFDTLDQQLQSDGWPAALRLHTLAATRHEYLLRPDRGRRLDVASMALLNAWRTHTAAPTLALVIGDGLSALGVQQHAAALLRAIHDLAPAGLDLGPPVLVEQARVAVGDEIGQALGARLVAMVIGERPGLSSPDSLGIYLTYAPGPNCTDAQRNCISNVRPAGQPPLIAAQRLIWLVQEALRTGITGIGLKDLSGLALTGDAPGIGPL